jgi:hypothetical protein
MSLPVVVFPDAEALVIDYLADRLGSTVKVGAELPESIGEVIAELDGVVVVSLLDTADVLDFVLKDPALEIGVLAADKAAASALARLVSAHMKAMPGAQTPGARVYTATEEGFSWEPDEPTGLPQYVVTVVLRFRPA